MPLKRAIQKYKHLYIKENSSAVEGTGSVSAASMYSRVVQDPLRGVGLVLTLSAYVYSRSVQYPLIRVELITSTRSPQKFGDRKKNMSAIRPSAQMPTPYHGGTGKE
eukprot:1160037-Pelagomonas_calceolata.AAC.2